MFYGGAWIRLNGKKMFAPFSPENVDCSAYEMCLGNEAFISSSGWNLSSPKVDMLDSNSTVNIPAGQFAYLTTKEIVNIPSDIFALINVKSKFKVQGLVNVSGFHVDPGYKGKLVFAVFNAGPREISIRGSERVFLIWFAQLKYSHEKDAYNKKGFERITSDLTNNIPRQGASLSSLDKRLRRIEVIVMASSTLLIAFIASFSANLFTK